MGSILPIQVACYRALFRYQAWLSGLWLALASLALFETIAVAVQFEDVDVVGQSVEQRTGQPLRPEHAGPLVEWQIAGDDGGAALIALAEDLKQELGAGHRKGYIAEFIDDQQLVTGSGSIFRSMAVSSPDLKAFLLATPFFGGLSVSES